ncbi:hypothetical protein MXB_883 [Myxobolus squamalis]|nr:hypothetical protein MXB_883 [Myxobolus squamalis]
MTRRSNGEIFTPESTNEWWWNWNNEIKPIWLINDQIEGHASLTNIMISSSHGYKMIDKESIIYFENMENVSMPSSFIKAGAMLFLEPPLNSNSKEYVELLNNLYGNKLIAKLTTEIFPSWSDEIDKRISSIIVIPNCGILILEKIQDVIYSLTLIKKIEEKEDGYLYNNCPEMGGYLLAKGPNINYYGDLKDLTNIDRFCQLKRLL